MTTAGARVAPVRVEAGVPDLLDALASALAGGPALLPLPPQGAPSSALVTAAALGEPLDEGTALLLATSGSTGTPRVVALGADALLASARVSQDRLGGSAQWLLALPLSHVAGWQVLVRSIAAGTQPVALAAGARFTPAAFAAAAAAMTGARRCTALVPTQLARVLEDPVAARAAAGLDAVLLGGAAAPPPLLEAARSAGVRVVTSYGSTETAGGCVYDGVPLDGVLVSVEDGRVALSGPVLASGYRGQPEATAAAFVQRGGRPWYLTPDLGRLVAGAGGPALQVLGRGDDVVVTGGEKVSPAAVEAVLAGLRGVRDAVVVGVADPHWGQAVVAVVVPDATAAPPLEALRATVRERLGGPSAPRHLVVVDELPALALGKPDRAAVRALAVRRLTDAADGSVEGPQ